MSVVKTLIGNGNSSQTNSTWSNSTDIDNDENFELTWKEILHDGGLASWIPRSSVRWLTIVVCLIGVLGKLFRKIMFHFVLISSNFD